MTLEDEPNLVSSTALYPTMNASEHLVAAAQVIAFALQKGQIRTSAVAALCRIAIELLHPGASRRSSSVRQHRNPFDAQALQRFRERVSCA